MRRLAAIILFTITVIAGLIYSGSIASFLLSSYLTGALNQPVTIKNISPRSWNTLALSNIEIQDKSNPLMMSEKGILRVSSILPFPKYYLELQNTHIWLNSRSWLKPLTKQFPSNQIYVKTISAHVSAKPNKRLLVHFVSAQHEDFELKGGLELLKSRPKRASIYLFFGKSIYQKLSESILSKLRDKNNGKTLRLLYGNNRVSLWGKNGPLLELNWSFSN